MIVCWTVYDDESSHFQRNLRRYYRGICILAVIYPYLYFEKSLISISVYVCVCCMDCWRGVTSVLIRGLCSRSQCRLTGHCTVMPLSTCGSLHQSPTSSPDKDFGLPPRTICAFLPSDCLLLDVVLSLSLALVFGTLFLPTSLQHLLCSLSENV